MTGRTISHYRILEKLGEGGMGIVYKAEDTKLLRTVALKFLPLDAVENRERFLREAQAAAALNHPNICTIFEIDEEHNFIAMEFVDGPSVRGKIAERPLPLEEALDIAVQACHGLKAAHDKGVVHRDIKPANIMLTTQGQVKIMDFGLAQVGKRTRLTRAGMSLGTPAYMSPEQALAEATDARTDIWSLGVVLYEMVTGRPPFGGEKEAAVAHAILHAQPEPLTALRSGLPIELDRIVTKALAKDPEQRYQHVDDLRVDLAATAPTKEPAQTRQSRLPWAVAGALAVASIVLGALLWRVPPPVELQLVRLDLDLGADVSASGSAPAVALSPDGARLVFVAQGSNGKSRLLTRRLAQQKAVELAGTEGASGPFFSPDGQWVGFFAGGKLKKTRLDGGEPVILCDSPAGRGASWGEDGRIIATLEPRRGLSRVPADGGKPTSVTELNTEIGEVGHRWPQVLPGGKAVLFSVTRVASNYAEASIEVVSLQDRQRKVLLTRAGMFPRYLPSGHLVYVNKGTLFAVLFHLDRLEVVGPATPVLEDVWNETLYGLAHLDFSRSGILVYRSGRRAGLSTLQWLDDAGRTESLRGKPENYLWPRLSPDGTRLAMALTEGSNTDIWVYDWRRDLMTRLTNGQGNSHPVWSPDGRYVVLQSAGGIFHIQADGAGKPHALTESKNAQFPGLFALDGKRLVFSELMPGGGSLIRTAALDDDSGRLRAGKAETFLATPSSNPYPAFSPDGRWLAYASTETGNYEVFVRAFPDKGGMTQISNSGGYLPVWSRNGHELFYRTDQRIMVVNYMVKGGAFVAEKPRVWSQRQLSNTGLSMNFDLAPDGKRFAVLMPVEGPEPQETRNHFTLVLNFFDEVRRSVAAAGK